MNEENNHDRRLWPATTTIITNYDDNYDGHQDYYQDYDDEDIFATVPEKQYREAGVYKVVDRITKYKEEQAKQA